MAYGCKRDGQEGGCQDTVVIRRGARAILGLCLPMVLLSMPRRQRSADMRSKGSLVSWHVWKRTVRHGEPVRVSPAPQGDAPGVAHLDYPVNTCKR